MKSKLAYKKATAQDATLEKAKTEPVEGHIKKTIEKNAGRGAFNASARAKTYPRAISPKPASQLHDCHQSIPHRNDNTNTYKGFARREISMTLPVQ